MIGCSPKPIALFRLKHLLEGWWNFGFKQTRTADREVYTIKVIRKSKRLKRNHEGHLYAGRDFLVASEKSRWVVPLIASFQGSTNLYLVMKFTIGEDFLGLLNNCHRLSEATIRFYIAKMIKSVEEIHRLLYIHRDVKPDSFLISSSGHLKISDFGLTFDGHWNYDQAYFSHHRYPLLEELGIKVEGNTKDQEKTMKTGNESLRSFISINDLIVK